MLTWAGFLTLRSTDRCLEDRVHLNPGSPFWIFGSSSDEQQAVRSASRSPKWRAKRFHDAATSPVVPARLRAKLRNTQFRLADLPRQSDYSRLAEYEDVNDAQVPFHEFAQAQTLIQTRIKPPSEVTRAPWKSTLNEIEGELDGPSKQPPAQRL
jgi:hypothetical protein